MDGVMQSLTEDRKIDTVFCDGRIFNIAKPVLEILESMLLRKLGTELDHFWRIIDGDHLACLLRQQLRECPLACAEVSHSQRREKSNERVCQRLPRAPRHMTSPKLPGQLIKVFSRFVLPFVQDELETRAIARRFRQFAREQPDYFRRALSLRIPAALMVCAVIDIFSNPAIGDYAGAFQLRQMTGNARLAHPQNLLELCYRKLFLFEKKQQAQSRRVCQQPQHIYG